MAMSTRYTLNKNERHYITNILLQVALITIRSFFHSKQSIIWIVHSCLPHLRADDHDGIVTHGRSREFRMHMKNPAQTGSGCIRINDLKIKQATFAEYSCPIRLRGAR